MRIPRVRWWRAALVAAAITLCAVIVLSWVVLRVLGPALSRERVEALLAEALGQPVRVGGVRLIPWRARLSVTDLEVPKASPAGLAARAASIDLSVDLASLWRRRLTVSAVATDLRLDMAIPRTESTGPSLFPLPPFFQIGPLHVGIGTVRVRGARVTIRDPDTSSTVEVGGADVVAGSVAGDLDVSGRLDTLRVNALEVERVDLEGRLSADAISIRRVGWRWHGEAMGLEGAVRRPWAADRELALHAKGRLGLAAVAKAAAMEGPLDGTAEVTAEISGPPGAPRVSGRIRIAELRGAPIAAREVAIDGEWKDATLRLDDIQGQVGTGRLRARLEAGPFDHGAALVAVEVREIALPGSLAPLGAGSGVVQGRLRDGGVDLTRAEAKWTGVLATLEGRVAGGASLSLRGRLSADLGEIGRALGWGATTGRASLQAELVAGGGTPGVAGRVEIAELTAAGQTFEPIEGSFRIAAAPGSSGRWAGDVEVPRVRAGDVGVENLKAALAVDGARVALVRATARAAGMPVEATGAWNWDGSGRGRATLGPTALAAISGMPAGLGLAGTGRASIEASVAPGGVASAKTVVDFGGVSARGVLLGAGRSEIRLRDRSVEGELSFPARRLHATVAGRLEARGTLTATVDLADLALRPLLHELGSAAAEHVDGRVSSRAEISLPLGDPAGVRGAVRVMPDGLRLLGDPWTSQGPLVLRWQGTRVAVERFRLDGPAGSLSATGSLWDAEQRGLTLALDNTRLPGGLARLGRGTARADLRLAGGEVALTRLDARWPRLTAVASGRARPDGSVDFDGRVDADLAALGPALGVSGIAGSATLTATARGRGDAVEVTGAARAPRVEVDRAIVQDVELPFRVSRLGLRIERAQARIGASRVSVDADARWKDLTPESLARDAHVKVEAHAPAVRLEDLAPLLPATLQGRGELTLSARAEGTPRVWRAGGTLTAPRLEIGAGPLRRLHLAFGADQTRVEVTDFRVDALGVPARGTGSWAWAGGGAAKAALGPASLGGLASVPPALALNGTGRATIDVTLRSLADVTGSARAELEDVAVAGAALGRGQVDLTARDGALRVELAFPEARLRVSGVGRVDAAGTLTAEAHAPGIDLRRFTGGLGVPGGLGGTLSASATARVPLARPALGDGALSIDPVRLVVAGETWESGAPIQARWARGGLTLSPFRLAATEGSVAGAGTLSADGTVEAQMTARLPLGLLRSLRPEVRDAGGILEASLRATGRASAPAITGDVAVHRGSLLLRDRPETLRELEARVSLSSQGAQLREATAVLGGGRVQAQGEVGLRGWRLGGYRMRVKAQNVSLGQVEGFSSAWDADLELGGLTGEAQLQGQARLVRGLYSRDLSIIALALSPSRAPAAVTGPGVRLSIRVDLDDNLVVRNGIADLRARGVLNVTGSTAQPVVFGTVLSQDGRFVFRNRDWTLASATVRFADPRRLDPYLDVQAATRIGEYDVTMQITGPSSNVQVRFTSVPRLSQNDLLSLVAFGVTGGELRESPGAVVLGEVGKLLARNLPGAESAISGFRVSTGSANSTAAEQRGFQGEERPSVGPAQNTPGGRKEKVRVEYQLLAPLYLSGEYDRDGGYGADVVLRFRFR